jgi:two-component system, NtrC family, nitrogen regulation response regulator NtrX
MSSPGVVLVVDDDEVTTATFARILRLDGFRTETALSVASALKIVDAAPIDAIILDLRMPQADGLDFLRHLRLRSAYRNVPVAIVTGDYLLDEPSQVELTELGAKLHFKPLWLEDLLALAHSMVVH